MVTSVVVELSHCSNWILNMSADHNETKKNLQGPDGQEKKNQKRKQKVKELQNHPVKVSKTEESQDQLGQLLESIGIETGVDMNMEPAVDKWGHCVLDMNRYLNDTCPTNFVNFEQTIKADELSFGRDLRIRTTLLRGRSKRDNELYSNEYLFFYKDSLKKPLNFGFPAKYIPMVRQFLEKVEAENPILFNYDVVDSA